MEIRFGGDLTYEDYRRALALHSRRARLVIYVILVLAALGVVAVPLFSRNLFDAMVPVMLAAVLVVFLVKHHPKRSWVRVRRQFLGLKGVASAAGLTLEGPAVRSELQWPAFLGHRLDDEVVLLYRTENMINIVSRSLFLTNQDWDAFRKLVRENVAGIGHGRLAPAPTEACAECQRRLPRNQLAAFGERWVCADCKPAFVQKLKEGVE